MATAADRLTDAMEREEEAQRKAREEAEKATPIHERLGRVFEFAIGMSAGQIATQAMDRLRQALVDNTRAALDTEDALTRAALRMDGTTSAADGYAVAIRELRDQATAAIFSQQEVSAAFAAVADAGTNAKEVMLLVNAAQNLAAISGEDLARTTKGLDDVLTAWSMSASDAGRLTDILWTTFKNTNTTIPELIQGLTSTGGTMRALGLDIEEATALVGALRDTSVESLNGVLLAMGSLRDSDSELSQTLRRLKVDVYDANGELRNLPDILRDVDARGADATEILRLFGLRGAPSIQAVIDRFEDLDRIARENKQSLGAAEEAAGQFALTGSARFQKFLGDAKDLGLAIGQGIASAIGNALAAGDSFIQWLNSGTVAATAVTGALHGLLAAGAAAAVMMVVEAIPALVAWTTATFAGATANATFTALLPGVGVAMAAAGLAAAGAAIAVVKLTQASTEAAPALDFAAAAAKNNADAYAGLDDEARKLALFLQLDFGLSASQARLVVEDWGNALVATKNQAGATMGVTLDLTRATSDQRAVLGENNDAWGQLMSRLDGGKESILALVDAHDPLIERERALKEAAEAAKDALDRQRGVTREKTETTQEFERKLRDAGFAEKDIRTWVDETTVSLKEQRDGTTELVRVVDGVTKTYTIFRGEVVNVKEQSELLTESTERRAAAHGREAAAVREVSDALGMWKRAQEEASAASPDPKTANGAGFHVFTVQGGDGRTWSAIALGNGGFRMRADGSDSGATVPNASFAAQLLGIEEGSFTSEIVRQMRNLQLFGDPRGPREGTQEAGEPAEPPFVRRVVGGVQGFRPNGSRYRYEVTAESRDGHVSAVDLDSGARHGTAAPSAIEGLLGIGGGALRAMLENAGLRYFAKGGVTDGPTLAVLGDNPSGKEYVIPDEQVRGIMGAGGPQIVIHQLVVRDGRDFDRTLAAWGVKRRALG